MNKTNFLLKFFTPKQYPYSSFLLLKIWNRELTCTKSDLPEPATK